MNPLKVLLVVYAFPPAGGVGTLRAASLARYLPAEGIRLDVLTTRNPSSVGSDRFLLNEIPQEVTVHRTFTLDIPFGIKKRLKNLLFSTKPNSPTNQLDDRRPKPNLVKSVFQDVLLPDPQVTWLPVLTRAAFRIVRERNIDLVLITGAPFSDYLLAERLRKKYPALPIVLDFRDEWLSTIFGAASFGFSRSERARRFAIRAEADAISSATGVVSVTRAALREIRARYPNDHEGKYHYIPNGFDGAWIPSVPSPSKMEPDGRICATYIGSLYGSTDPMTLIEALKLLPTNVKSRFKVRFIGHVEHPRYSAALRDLGNIAELKGYLPQCEALNAISESDYALLISHDPINVSAKFYDYLGAGKPILACIHPEGEIRQLLEDLRAGWWADVRDADSIRQLFIDAATRGKPPFSNLKPDTAGIAQYERKPLAKRYAALLHSIAASAHGASSEHRDSGCVPSGS